MAEEKPGRPGKEMKKRTVDRPNCSIDCGPKIWDPDRAQPMQPAVELLCRFAGARFYREPRCVNLGRCLRAVTVPSTPKKGSAV